MSLFQCEKCGCCENTALCLYWPRKAKKQALLCSACDPDIGEWQGKFERTFLPPGEFATNGEGNLAHKATGETDFRKYALQPNSGDQRPAPHTDATESGAPTPAKG